MAVIGNYLVEVYFVDISQPLTARTCTLWRIKGKGVWRGVAIGDAGSRTHHATGEMLHLSCLIVHDHDETFALFHGDADRLLQAFVDFSCSFWSIRIIRRGFHCHTVYHHLDVVRLIAVHLHAAGNFLHLTVYPDVHIALAAHVLEEFAIVTFSALYQWRHDEDFASGIVVGNHVDNLLFGIFHHRLARHIAIGLAGTGKEQSHIVVDFGSGTYCRTWILVGGFLFDADNGRQSRNFVDIRTFHASQKVTGIG